MSDFNQMRTFCLVAELGTLAAAGRELSISSAAISKQLTALETMLGVQLLQRTTRHVELTDLGQAYYAQCQKVFEELDEAYALIAQMKAVPSGVLKVISGRHFAAAYITPHLKEFLSLYPSIELSLEFAERVPDLQTEAIDVSIGMSVSAVGDVIQRKIDKTRYVLTAAPSYVKKFGTPKTLEALKSHRYITHSMRRPDDEITFNKGKSVKIGPYLRVNDTETMLKLAEEGLGIVYLHDYVVENALKEGRLVQLLPNLHSEEIPLYLAYPQRRFLAGKVRCFIDFVLSKMKV